jgi:hypothetical protein
MRIEKERRLQIRPLLSVIMIVWMLWGCAGGYEKGVETDAQHAHPESQTYQEIKALLGQPDKDLDYDVLMDIHNVIRQAQAPIPHMDAIIENLINKRNPNPRVDNIILIVAAVALGDSAYPIDNAASLFEALLNQDHRLNTWVLAYVADALGKYPVDLPEGDQLAERLEAIVNHLVKNPDPGIEFFGYHFLPPPKGDYIRDYIQGIDDQRTRVFERNCYYILIANGIPEARVEDALHQVQNDKEPKSEAQTNRPLKYIIQHWNLFFPDIAPKRDPRPEGL